MGVWWSCGSSFVLLMSRRLENQYIRQTKAKYWKFFKLPSHWLRFGNWKSQSKSATIAAASDQSHNGRFVIKPFMKLLCSLKSLRRAVCTKLLVVNERLLILQSADDAWSYMCRLKPRNETGFICEQFRANENCEIARGMLSEGFISKFRQQKLLILTAAHNASHPCHPPFFLPPALLPFPIPPPSPNPS